jgi:hypothetical protein
LCPCQEPAHLFCFHTCRSPMYIHTWGPDPKTTAAAAPARVFPKDGNEIARCAHAPPPPSHRGSASFAPCAFVLFFFCPSAACLPGVCFSKIRSCPDPPGWDSGAQRHKCAARS